MTRPQARLSPELILRLQTTVGNRAVQCLLERRPNLAGPEDSAASQLLPESFPPAKTGLRWLSLAVLALLVFAVSAILWFALRQRIFALTIAAAVLVVGLSIFRHRAGSGEA